MNNSQIIPPKSCLAGMIISSSARSRKVILKNGAECKGPPLKSLIGVLNDMV